jgi:hypothetical protein
VSHCQYIRIAQLPLIILALIAHSHSEESEAQATGDTGFQGGSVFEVRFEDGQQSPVLFRFYEDGRFDLMDSYGVSFSGRAHWRMEGQRFRIETTEPVGWEATGTIAGNRLAGMRKRSANGSTKEFSGTKIDYSTYVFPLRTNEVIVEMQLQSYVYGRDFPTATELEGHTDDLPYQDELVRGFIFKVTRPKKYEGQFVTSHHDGTLPSGPARAIAEVGKKYLWRTDSRAIGGRDFDLCSMALYGMKVASAGSADPRYRMWFVQTPKARDQDGKQKK